MSLTHATSKVQQRSVSWCAQSGSGRGVSHTLGLNSHRFSLRVPPFPHSMVRSKEELLAVEQLVSQAWKPKRSPRPPKQARTSYVHMCMFTEKKNTGKQVRRQKGEVRPSRFRVRFFFFFFFFSSLSNFDFFFLKKKNVSSFFAFLLFFACVSFHFL